MQKQVNVLFSGLMHYKIPLNIHRNDGSMHNFSALSLNILEISQNQLFKTVVWDFQNARRSNSEICQSGVGYAKTRAEVQRALLNMQMSL